MSRYSCYTDDELICLVAASDRVAFTEIYERYAGVLYRHARKKLNDRDTAKDLVHDLFASFWKKRATLAKETRLSGYLHAAIRYKIINYLVREKRLAQFEAIAKDTVMEQQFSADSLVREKELKQLVEAEVRQLPKKMRKIFYMSRELHLTHKEIAEQLNLSPATVKKQVNNALKVLRIKLEALLAIISLLNL